MCGMHLWASSGHKFMLRHGGLMVDHLLVAIGEYIRGRFGPDSEPWPRYVWLHLLLIGVVAVLAWALANVI